MKKTRTLAGMALAAWCAAVPAAADTACRAASGERTLPLVELYTSEGCNSCPPADRWLAKSFVPGVAANATALAFHVDYWDRLGWPDRFANASWTARQQEIARASRNAVVYTPQVVLQGRDFPDWRSANAARDVTRAGGLPSRASIEIVARPDSRRVAVVVTAAVRDAADRAGARLVVAYADSNHATDVRRGENAGVSLAHDHVVRALVTSAPADSAGALRVETSFERPADAGRHPRIVAFVERSAAREVLQTVALATDDCRR